MHILTLTKVTYSGRKFSFKVLSLFIISKPFRSDSNLLKIIVLSTDRKTKILNKIFTNLMFKNNKAIRRLRSLIKGEFLCDISSKTLPRQVSRLSVPSVA